MQNLYYVHPDVRKEPSCLQGWRNSVTGKDRSRLEGTWIRHMYKQPFAGQESFGCLSYWVEQM